MGPRLWGSLSPCSRAFPFPRSILSPRTPWDWSAARCWRRSGDAAAQRPVSPAQQAPSPHGGLLPEPGPLAPSNSGSSGPCTAAFAQKLRSPPAQADLGG